MNKWSDTCARLWGFLFPSPYFRSPVAQRRYRSIFQNYFSKFSSIQVRHGYRVTCSLTVTYDVIFHDPLQFTFLSRAKVTQVRPTWEVKGVSLSKDNLQSCFQRVGGEFAFTGLLYKLPFFIVTEDESVSIVVAN